jgi:sulfotransferase family protein
VSSGKHRENRKPKTDNEVPVVIVWIASYPRSGNTFLRIVLNRLYGAPTYSIYDDDDPVAQRVGPDLVGYRPKPERAVMSDSAEVYFTKTHKRRKGDGYRAIYLVRDGRDAVVSDAHLRMSQRRAEGGDGQTTFEAFLREEITRPYLEGQPSSGSWGGNVLNWLGAADASVALLKYEDLIVDPRGSVGRVVSSLLPELVPGADAVIPSFSELHDIDPLFFRRGAAQSYRDEMSDELHELFWAQPENATAMRLLRYVE